MDLSGVGFQYDWEAYYSITGITEGGPAQGILRTGDRIIKVSSHERIHDTTIQCMWYLQVGSIPVNKEKPSQVKKLLKPHKGVLRLTIERKVEPKDGNYLTAEPPPLPVTEVLTPTKSASGSSDQGSLVKPVDSTIGTDGFTHSGQESTISGHSATTQDSVNSAMPERLGAAKNSREDRCQYVLDGARPVSDGMVYGFNDRRGGFDEDYMDSEPHSTGYSASESFLSEPGSYDCLPMDSSQTSIELTFHSISQVSHNRLTVQSTMSTQPEVKEKHSVHEPYFDRDDEARTTFRSRALSADGQRFGTSSQLPEQDTQKHTPRKMSKTRRLLLGGRKHSKSGSLSQLPSIDTEECRGGCA